MELKYVKNHPQKNGFDRFNCTFMELKLFSDIIVINWGLF